MKNIKNSCPDSFIETNKSHNSSKSHRNFRTLAQERLSFKNDTELGALSIAIENGATKRKVRRIVEKRVCKGYWKTRKNRPATDNKDRWATKKYISHMTRSIFGCDIKGCSYLAA